MNWTPLQVNNSDVPCQLKPLESHLKESFNNLGFKTSLDSMNAQEFEESLEFELKKFPCNIEEAGYNEDKEQGFEEGARWAYQLTHEDRTPTEDDVKALGFELHHEYPHDEWQTSQYRKGNIWVEFTYDLQGNLETFEVSIEDSCAWRKCTISQLRVISEVWGVTFSGFAFVGDFQH